MKNTRYLSPEETSPVIFFKDGREIFFHYPRPTYDPRGEMITRLAALARARQKLKKLGWKEKTANA